MKRLAALLAIALVIVCAGCEPPRRIPQSGSRSADKKPPDTKPAVNTIEWAEELRAGLKSGDPQKRLQAAEALLRGGGETREVPATLSDLLEDQNTQIRTSAAAFLREMGLKAKEAVPALTRALRDQEPLVRGLAAQALGQIGPAAKEAVPALTETLRDNGTYQVETLMYVEFIKSDTLVSMPVYVRAFAAEALGQIKPEAASAIPSLQDLLKDEQASVRVAAATALGRMGPSAKGAVSALTAALHDKEPIVRAHAARALGEIGREAKAALPDLMALLPDETSDDEATSGSLRLRLPDNETVAIAGREETKKLSVGAAAAEALVRVGIQDLLKDANAETRVAAAKTLVRMRAAAEPALPELVAALRDENWEVRCSAAEAIGIVKSEGGGKLGEVQRLLNEMTTPEREPVTADLQRLLVDDQAPVREAAAVAIGKIGAAGREAVLDLCRLLKEEKASVREAAAVALGRIGLAANEAIPALTDLLRDCDRGVRAAAATALGKLAPDARTAIPVLKELTADESADVRQAAAEALKRIEQAKR